ILTPHSGKGTRDAVATKPFATHVPARPGGGWARRRPSDRVRSLRRGVRAPPRSAAMPGARGRAVRGRPQPWPPEVRAAWRLLGAVPARRTEPPAGLLSRRPQPARNSFASSRNSSARGLFLRQISAISRLAFLALSGRATT